MNTLLLISTVFFLLAILAGLIAYEFWKTNDGLLRKLIIFLFGAKVWFYTGIAMHVYLRYAGVVHGASLTWIVISTLPLFVAKVRWYIYVRLSK